MEEVVHDFRKSSSVKTLFQEEEAEPQTKESWLVKGQKQMCRMFVNFPCLMFSFGLIVIVGLSAAAIPAMELSENTEFDWTVTSSKESEFQDMKIDLLSQVEMNDKTASVVRSMHPKKTALQLIYSNNGKQGGPFFTPESVQAMCEIESLLWDMEEYQSTFCPLTSNPADQMPSSSNNCSTPRQSLVPRFYNWSSSNSRACVLLSKESVSQTEQTLKGGKDLLFLDKDALELGYTKITRSLLFLGGPLEGFQNIRDRKKEQNKLYKKFAEKLEKRIFEFLHLENSFFKSAYRSKAKHGPVAVRFSSLLFNDIEFSRVVDGDLLWTLASITFVFVYITIHTGSFFLAIVGMLQILLSIPISFFIYRFLFGIPYFTQLHILVIFLVLGVGADDIFVLSDTWNQVGRDPAFKNRIFERALHTYNLAFLAVFNTSFTTAMAFLSTAFSPIMPISAFGIFAAIAIVVNYIYVVFFTPAALVLYHKYFEHRGFCGCCVKNSKNRYEKVSQEYVLAVNLAHIHAEMNLCSVTEESSKSGLINRFFSGFYSRLITNKIFATIVLVFFFGYLIQAVYCASQLTPPEKEEEWFPKDHMWTGINDYLSNNFLAGPEDSYVEASIIWGAKGIDRSSYSVWKPSENRGTVLYDDTFDISSTAAQNHLIKACTVLSSTTCTLSGCMDRSKKLLRPDQIDCWIKEMKSAHNGTLPSGKHFLPALRRFHALNPDYTSLIGFVKDKLKFVRFTFRLTLQYRQPFSRTNPVKEKLYQIANELNQQGPIKNAFIEGGRIFPWTQTEKALVDGLYNGLAICFPVAFIVLLLATGNLLTSFYAIISIASIVFSVLGFCYAFLGWSLGTAESIAAIIVIGFSVDYVVHLGHIYQESKANHRAGKVADTARIMAPTVFAGAMTTLGASLFMSGCQMVFFTKMSVLISLTITFSLLYSLLFYMCLLSQLGPQGRFGSLKSIVAKCMKKEK